ncbi:MAG: alcohol dehydrogenase catalytic domain-containing protein, partial [Magnetospirillum sp.]|nr:alcohol dehydrogenase catalytic domain-containing protein [Magnetospirillum sp.]
MTKVIRIHEFGGPEVMCWEEVELRAPGPHEALVRHTAIGVNFIDVYHRTGLYPLALPTVLGLEGAGIVEAIGPDVVEVRVGDRVAY